MIPPWRVADAVLRQVLKPKYSNFYVVQIPLDRLRGLDENEAAELIEKIVPSNKELLHYSYECGNLVLRYG